MKKKIIKHKQNKQLIDLLNEWNNLQIINVEQLSKDYYSLLEKDFGLINFFNEIWMFGRLLTNMIWDNKFNSYHKTIEYSLAMLLEVRSKLNIYLTKMFNTINGINIAIKFKKFDNEISEYKNLINQKQKELNTNPLVVKRKIDILNDKIKQTLELKQQFVSNSKQRSKDEYEDFKVYVDNLLNPKLSNSNSLSKITNYSNDDELDKLKIFIKKYWSKIVNHVNNCINVIEKMKLVKV